jgi:hypothetical protein
MLECIYNYNKREQLDKLDKKIDANSQHYFTLVRVFYDLVEIIGAGTDVFEAIELTDLR